MFTGLIERLAHSASIEERGEARHFTIAVADADYLHDAQIGESIAVSGVCLTATGLTPTSFNVSAVEETLRRTSLGARKVGDAVNLERALPVGARMGGHIVQGHVDGVADIIATRDEGEGWWVTFQPPFGLMRYIVGKGSICLDGVSLTVANVAYNKFSVALIPHTREVTAAGSWQSGARVNVEVDIVAKYVERLTQWVDRGG
ncbi:MAG: riboflavin synthase [Armatimonadetes bacterium]|nr:riboflavin synthase [Armatimonadota bacterium]